MTPSRLQNRCRARVAARTRLELQRCTDTQSPSQPIAPVPIPEAHVEPNEEAERSPDGSEPRMRVPPGGSFDIHVPGYESNNTAMSATEIVTETGPCDRAAKQLTPPPEVPPVHPLPPTTNPVQTVESVPSTETLLGLIFQGSSGGRLGIIKAPGNHPAQAQRPGDRELLDGTPQPGGEWRHRHSYDGRPRRTDNGGQQRA
ncbi:unnamed protein product [Ixodes pacificus]